MRHLLILTTVSLACVACTKSADTPSTSTASTGSTLPTSAPATTRPAIPDRIVVRATYSSARSPCYEVAPGRRVTYKMDTFSVTGVLAGGVNLSHITVRPLGGAGPGYPASLEEGAEYTLTLQPSQDTRRQLLETPPGESANIIINGVELAQNTDG
jgi:hypothetical protein